MQSILVGFGRGGRMRTLGERDALALRGGLFELGAIAREAFDQAVDQVAGADMRDVLHDGRDVDDGVVALQHAELEVVEIEDFHLALPRLASLSRAGCPPACPARAYTAFGGRPVTGLLRGGGS